ncbi:MAG: gliding motility-associated ABC transporter ATP-binding subunit GldA [Bacteroidales bacterium]|jgi:ABC-2 type transport system ATP-binding protein|nr:gliding motility-associated ABC transporter ATP-binding subunit GldA [Bacteroidales bacterium]
MSIVVQSVTKYYGEQKALDNVSFRINTGEIVGFLGPNGAGKSTMMKIITGYIPPTSGNVFVNDISITDDSSVIRRKLGYLPENNPLYPEMYVREYLEFAASLYRSDIPLKQQVDEIIEITGLAPERRKKIGSLSKGYRQRVGLAQALIHNPEVLILDEATTGLDPNQIVEIRNLIRDAGKEKTVMLSTHIMQEVEAICDRVIIIDKGVVVADEEKKDIYSKISQPQQVVLVEFDREPDETLLAAIPMVSSVRKLKAYTWIIEASGGDDIRSSVFRFAVSNKLTVLSLQKQENNLEEVFRLLTNG